MNNHENMAQTDDNDTCTMKGLIEIIARALVDHPDCVMTAEISSSHSLILELNVAKEDLGQIIGKKGRIADAIKTLVKAVSAKTGKRSVLEILE